jgi:dUTP pyrophosphatase
MTPGASGMDICASVNGATAIPAGDIVVIPTGLAAAVPEGYEIQIRPRSGLAARHGISLVNSPGTIDADYRGEIMLPVINMSRCAYTIQRGDRVAQMVVNRIYQMETRLVHRLDDTERSNGGFGHTGYR